ncbi:hypothetical protein [Leuconostoc citreum]|uniref:hypothetical protein n=1 Tax=Leuconostoc citreum TaxID=33964 RepID=UPI002A830BB7|nr:hypothetical protein [Leuconostoc citreum]MDY5162917.1 hypothetical protein [Leuconostoc citreum]MDY5166504.1 hypothetical protein [Leuconostoc citreum]
MNSKLNFANRMGIINSQMYVNIAKVKRKNLSSTPNSAISKLITKNHSFMELQAKNQTEALRKQSNFFYNGLPTPSKIELQSLFEAKSKILKNHHSLAFPKYDDLDYHNKLRELAEQSKKRQEKLKQILVRINQKFEYFHENGWLVPDQLDIDKLDNINSAEDANKYMENNLIDRSCLLLLTLNTCLDQDDLPNNAREVLGNVVNSLKKDYSNYKVMLPTIFSIIDCIIKERLSEYLEQFKFINKNAISHLKEKTDQKKCNKHDNLFYLYQSSIGIDILSTKYYPLDQSKEDTTLTRNSVAHGSFDYTKYTVSDFAKVVLIIEHISGLREFLEE